MDGEPYPAGLDWPYFLRRIRSSAMTSARPNSSSAPLLPERGARCMSQEQPSSSPPSVPVPWSGVMGGAWSGVPWSGAAPWESGSTGGAPSDSGWDWSGSMNWSAGGGVGRSAGGPASGSTTPVSGSWATLYTAL